MPPTKRDSIAIPVAIVIAAGLIAGAIYFTSTTDTTPQAPVVPTENGEIVVPPINDNDHVRGNPNAEIVIVEYSDFDCPFCKDFHETMSKIMDEYGSGGNIAWVFRHFPITSRHPNAVHIAEASECVAELGGHPAFWKFSDLIFGSKTFEEFTDISKLSEYAAQSGVLDVGAFDTCLASGKYKAMVTASIEEATKAGAGGTPYPVIMTGNQIAPLRGALPYADMKVIVDSLIAQLQGTGTTTQ